jgi:bacteriocin-like protein
MGDQMERAMSTQKNSETSKQERSTPAANITKKDENELSEKELARTTGGTGQTSGKRQ